MDDKDGKLNPYSNKNKLSNILRKTDKPVQDDGNYDVKYNADDRLYKDLEDAEYDVFLPLAEQKFKVTLK
jgi:hypothetical protein